MTDDKVCVHYVIKRLETIIQSRYDRGRVGGLCYEDNLNSLVVDIEAFKRELVYNLGVNSRIKHAINEQAKETVQKKAMQ